MSGSRVRPGRTTPLAALALSAVLACVSAGCSTTSSGTTTTGAGNGGAGTAGSAAGSAAASGATGEAVPGVTDTSITLGALSALTGTFAAGAKRQLEGAQLFWKAQNAAGGVCNRQVTITAQDNQYDPQKTVTAYDTMNSQILAVQLLTGTAMTQAVQARMSQQTVSAIPMSWSPDLLGKPSILIPGTTYDVDMINGVDYLLEKGMLKSGDHIGYIYFAGDFGGAGLAGAQHAAALHGITVDAYQVPPTTTDLTAQINQIAGKNSAAIFMSTSPPLLANAAALAATKGLKVPFVVPTPTFVPELLKSAAAGQLSTTYVVSPYNAWSATGDGMTALREAFAKDGDGGSVQQFLIAGYAAAQLMYTALKTTCDNGPLTRASLAKTFASATSFSMKGLSVDLDYSNRGAPASLSDYIHKVDPAAPGGLTPVQPDPYKGPDAAQVLKGK